LIEIAEKHGKTPAQIALKWSLQKGYLPLPKSVTPTRITENGQLFDFELSVGDIATIDTLHGATRMTSDPDQTNF
jgi:diketogulonate reductase-like aldo/keto reductase